MKRFVSLDECRSLTVTVNSLDKMLTLQEDLDGEVETVSMTFDEAYKAFNTMLDVLNEKISAVS